MSNIAIPNTDPETGIRYGVIPFNDLFNCGEAFFYDADDLTFAAYIQEAKDKIKRGIEGALDDFGVKAEDIENAATVAFDDVEQALCDRYQPDCPHLEFKDDEYVITKLDETDLFVAKSPYFTFAPECSPCAPRACYLRDGIKPNFADPEVPIDLDTKEVKFRRESTRTLFKCYCLGHEWFDDDQAPYAVYSVETGKRVEPSSI